MKNCFVLHIPDRPERMPQIAIADLTGLGDMVPGTMTITRINVPTWARGQGYGSKLLREILDAADTEETPLSLEVMPSGPLDYDELVRWYKRYGFRETVRWPGIYIRRPHAKYHPSPPPPH